MEVEELAPDMCPTGRFPDPTAFKEAVKASVAVGMQHAGKGSQVPAGMFALAIWGVPEPHRRRHRAGPRPLVAHVRPDPRRLGLPGTRGEHRVWSVIGVQVGAAYDVAPQGVHERFQECMSSADPVGER
jgi:hypothetical protein